MDNKILEIQLSSTSISADDLLNILYHANIKLPVHIFYSNQNDVFYLEFAHSDDAINALKMNDKPQLSAKLVDSVETSSNQLRLIHSIPQPTQSSWNCAYCSFSNSAALSFCPRCLRPSDIQQSTANNQNQPLNQHSTSGPPVGSILNPLVVGNSEMHAPSRPSTTPRSAIALSPPLLPSSPLSSPNSPPLSTMSTISASPPHSTPPQNLFDVLASLPTPTNAPNQYAPQIPSRNPPQLQSLSPKPPQEFQLPPILNTGSQGPMQMQPGDWVCTCGFVNWRRRKCCYRCYPFANGNNGELARAAQRAAQLASLPESDNERNTQDLAFAFDTQDLNVPQELLNQELNNDNISYISALQAQYPRPLDHPAPGTEAAYRIFLASKKAWGMQNGVSVNEHGLVDTGQVSNFENHENFDELKEILQRVQSRR